MKMIETIGTLSRPVIVIAAFWLLAGGCFGSPSGGKPQCCSVDDVVRMKQQAVADDLIIAAVRSAEKRPALTADDLIKLSNAGVSQVVIDAMLGKATTAEAPEPPAAAVVMPEPTPDAAHAPDSAPEPARAEAPAAADLGGSQAFAGSAVVVPEAESTPAAPPAQATAPATENTLDIRIVYHPGDRLLKMLNQGKRYTALKLTINGAYTTYKAILEPYEEDHTWLMSFEDRYGNHFDRERGIQVLVIEANEGQMTYRPL
ncbi:MAG: hypothetical protein HYV63_23720 [Candidatus Schekmanbacteria bacterium]|nr:hypothetical protein [Candidatus Schekmanbacteria bacterium]